MDIGNHCYNNTPRSVNRTHLVNDDGLIGSQAVEIENGADGVIQLQCSLVSHDADGEGGRLSKQRQKQFEMSTSNIPEQKSHTISENCHIQRRLKLSAPTATDMAWRSSGLKGLECMSREAEEEGSR